MKFRLINKEDFALVDSVFDGDTSGEVAPPNPVWWKYVTTSENVSCILHFEDDQPVAVTQFDLEDRNANVSVFIREGMRGKGLFNLIIKDAITLLPKQIRTVTAYISEANHRSISAFKKVGFEGALYKDEDGLLVFKFDLNAK